MVKSNYQNQDEFIHPFTRDLFLVLFEYPYSLFLKDYFGF